MTHQPPTQPAGPREDLVWHYTDAGGLLSILGSHTLWATSSAFLNDRQEVLLGAERLLARIQELAEESDDDFYVELAKRATDSVLDADDAGGSHFFILSASQVWDSLAMWRLYGGSRESYAIGLDARESLAILGSEALVDDPDDVLTSSLDSGAIGRTRGGLMVRRLDWSPVRYDEAGQNDLIGDLVQGLPAQISQFKSLVGAHLDPAHREPVHREPGATPDWHRPQPPSEFNRPDHGELTDDLRDLFTAFLDDLTAALLLIKHPGFIDERESRLAFVTFAPPNVEIAARAEAGMLRYRSSAYGIAPYLSLTGASTENQLISRTPNPLPIRAVAISPSPNGPQAEKSLERLLVSHGYTGVEVLRSAIPFRGA